MVKIKMFFAEERYKGVSENKGKATGSGYLCNS